MRVQGPKIHKNIGILWSQGARFGREGLGGVLGHILRSFPVPKWRVHHSKTHPAMDLILYYLESSSPTQITTL